MSFCYQKTAMSCVNIKKKSLHVFCNIQLYIQIQFMHEVNLFAVLKYYKHLLHILSASLYFIFKSVVTLKSQKDSE